MERVRSRLRDMLERRRQDTEINFLCLRTVRDAFFWFGFRG